MKCYEKQLTGFCVTYLHNPFECAKCCELMDSDDDDDFKETFFKLFTEKDITLKPLKPNTEEKSVPSNNLVHKTKTVSKDTDFIAPLPLSSTPLSSKFSKKKNFCCIDAPNYGQSPTPFGKINKIKSTPKSSKKSCIDKTDKSITVKKHANKSVLKSSGDKIPGKGTLKRKRWFLEQLQQKNSNYEDDLFEDKKFGHFQNLLEDESDNPENYTGLQTPVFPFSLSPRESTPSPEYIDCYSEEQLTLSRKRCEEYQYSLKKRRKLDLPKSNNEPETPRVVQETQPDTILERLIQVEKILSSHITQEISDTEDDQYFSDLL